MSSSGGPIDWSPMIIGFAAGFLSRLISIRTGRSHYPGFPSGYISQLALAIIAAMIGSSVIVALVVKEFNSA
ncbi:MAG: YIEGIA domain-containing protein, partial [Sulfobacillus sp.]